MTGPKTLFQAKYGRLCFDSLKKIRFYQTGGLSTICRPNLALNNMDDLLRLSGTLGTQSFSNLEKLSDRILKRQNNASVKEIIAAANNIKKPKPQMNNVDTVALNRMLVCL